MNQLYTNAIRKASEVRLKLGFNLYEPINIYDVCAKLEIDVQFVDINMEGLYVSNGQPKILISCLRPFPRRVFTCGHELGHHMFNHGLKVDILSDESEVSSPKSDDEILVDAFSAHLLMPISCVQSEFNKRKLNFQTANPIDYYIVSSVLGVGYKTLISHCRANRLIDVFKASELLKYTPAKIFQSYIGNVEEKTFFKIMDCRTDKKPIDLEVSNYLILPKDFQVDEDFLEKKQETAIGSLFLAKKSGIFSIHSNKIENSCFVRVQPQNYIGFADYRHLEN
jgi:Zn-dependent peptidase ImmA (M78 family)